MSEIVKPVEVIPSRKIRVDIQESKPKTPNPPKGKLHDKPALVCHFCGKSGHICPNCFMLQAALNLYCWNKGSKPLFQSWSW